MSYIGHAAEVILRRISQALSPIGDLVAGWAVEQSSGLTHWDPVKRQWNLTLSSGRNTIGSLSHTWFGGGSPYLNLVQVRVRTINQ